MVLGGVALLGEGTGGSLGESGRNQEVVAVLTHAAAATAAGLTGAAAAPRDGSLGVVDDVLQGLGRLAGLVAADLEVGGDVKERLHDGVVPVAGV